MDFKDFLEYKDGLLFWRITLSPRALAGSKAGCLDKKSGYYRLRLKGKLYLAHRIVWEMHYGAINPHREIDHINHVRRDNRIENLRLVDSSANSKNQKLHSSNTSGVMGVVLFRGKWHARITADNVKIHLGTFSSFEEAVLARKRAEARYGFHENHGNK